MATQLHAATRQQLDELDALLQKMLDGPGRPVDSPAKPVFPSGRPAPTPPPTAPQYTTPTVAYGVPPAPAFVAETAPAVTKKADAPPPHGWEIDLNPRSGSSVLGERSPLAEKLANGTFAETSLSPQLQLTSLPEAVVSQQVSEKKAHPIWTLPAVSINRRFDALAKEWGFLGRLATGAFGRTLLGWSGVAMLGLSAYWLVTAWAGWSGVGGIVR